MKKRIQNILVSISVLTLFIVLSSFAVPTNPVNPGTISPILNANGSLSIGSGNLGEIIMASPSGNPLHLFGPNSAAFEYNITFMDTPTNGPIVGTINNVTNLVLSSVKAVTQNVDVLVAGGTTNRIFISNGIITNVIAL